jgi:hypothetical protein
MGSVIAARWRGFGFVLCRRGGVAQQPKEISHVEQQVDDLIVAQRVSVKRLEGGARPPDHCGRDPAGQWPLLLRGRRVG